MTTSKLPAHVYAVKDRHGKVRHRFIRKGWKTCYLAGEVDSPEFHRAYADALACKVSPVPASAPVKATPRSLDDLFARSKDTPRWAKKKPRTQLVQSRMVERFLDRKDPRKRRYGERPVETVTVVWLDKVFSEMHETPAAANVLRKVLAGLMDHAVRMGWRTDNPVRFTETYAESKEGFHTWTDAEIQKYRDRHALGTMARLTLELALNTAARRCNVATLTREDIVDGRIRVDHAKGNNDASVPLLATTKAAIEALPIAPIRHLIVTQFGKPFTEPGLGNRVRKWCDAADLKQCSLHGLRKATSRMLAETGASDAEGQSVTGHKKATTFQHYRAKANRALLADRAFSNLVSHEGFQPRKKRGSSDT